MSRKVNLIFFINFLVISMSFLKSPKLTEDSIIMIC